MKIAICDDMVEIASTTEQLLLDYNKNLFDIDIFYDGERLLDMVEEEQYDLFFLDIEMPGISGVELAESLRQKGVQSPIIFLTSYKQYMEDVFRLHTFDYLLKPITQDKMFAVLDRVMSYLNVSEHRFVFSFNKVTHTLLLSDILYFEKSKRNVIIHTVNGTYEVVMTTDELLTKVDSRFVQVHKSFIINAQNVKELRNDTIILSSAQGKTYDVPMSRRFAKTAKEKILMELREIM
ncbi:MAG: LytTR family DNA-binding domain-containing protein [Streptococcaceae bacterium]|jgi:DNA-binding LytR/AlgR family response regulator|nr:LytTR family DNA-binding domain-containing protein [Streptococcaceae bacterium]